MKKQKPKAQMSLEMIVGLIILLVVAAVVIKIFMSKVSGDTLNQPETLELEKYRQSCDALCQRYIDSNFDPAESLQYCQQYFPIDINKDGKTLGEAAEVSGYGLCEDRIYCFNLKECSWGAGSNSRLTPEKCRAIMCDVYTERMAGNGEIATAEVLARIKFGSCGIENVAFEIESTAGTATTTYYRSQWYLDTFGNVNCSERDYENDYYHDYGLLEGTETIY